MRLFLTTLAFTGVFCALFAVMAAVHEPRKTVTKDQVNARIYGWPHEWLAVTEDGRKEIVVRRFAFSFGMVVVLPTVILTTLSVLLMKPGQKK